MQRRGGMAISTERCIPNGIQFGENENISYNLIYRQMPLVETTLHPNNPNLIFFAAPAMTKDRNPQILSAGIWGFWGNGFELRVKS